MDTGALLNAGVDTLLILGAAFVAGLVLALVAAVVKNDLPDIWG